MLMFWVVLTGTTGWENIIVGSLVSALAAFLFYDIFFRVSLIHLPLREYFLRFTLILFFIPVFLYEAFISSLKVVRYAFQLSPTFSPGIIKVKTHLKNVTGVAILANLITLTPGTLTLDFDISERCFLVHCIDVFTEQEAELHRTTLGRFEQWVRRIFQK
jgi:multicomponent Na+:H+ antiporter subunit E